MRFRDWKLGKKYGVGVGIVLLLMAAANARSFRQLVDLKSDLEAVSHNWIGRIIAVSEINRSTSDLRMLHLQYASVTDTAIHAVQAEAIIDLIDRINANRDKYEDLRLASDTTSEFTAREEALYAQFDRNWDRYQTYTLSVVEMAMRGEREGAIHILGGEARIAFDSMSTSLVSLVRTNQSYAVGAADRAEANLRHLRHTSLVLFSITIGISIVFTFWLVRLISRPIQRLAAAAQTVAAGDLGVRLPVIGKDEVGQLSGAFNEMTMALSEAHDRSERQRQSIEEANRELQDTLNQLHETQDQLVLQEKMASLGQLVAGVSHELNTPAGALLGTNDVTGRIVGRIRAVFEEHPDLARTAPGQKILSLLDSLASNVDVTEQAGRRIQDIVGSLRSFVRLDESEYQLADIKEGIESSVTLLGSDTLRRVEIVRNYGDLPRIPCYPGQINQVFYNILRNAVQAIDDHGRVVIETDHSGSTVRIRISDTGRGIEPERLSQIYNVRLSTRGERVKMGSGLLTAYNIIKRHKGELVIDSVLGKGTTASITLPIGGLRPTVPAA
ncbi:MAG: HAMP domain-containing protein [Candidatus Zixiibacteriota bacterium]